MGRISRRAELLEEGLAFAGRLARYTFFALPVRWVDTWLDGPPDVPMTPIEEHDVFPAMDDYEVNDKFSQF